MMTGAETSVGVVIRTRDRPVFVPRALASVQAQTHRNWHIVLVNDGGDRAMLDSALAPVLAPDDDDTAPLPAARLTVLHLDPGVGRAAAFNRGVAALDTDFVTCLDDDDTWAPGFMAALTAFWAETAPQVPDLGGVAARVTAMRETLVETARGVRIRGLGEDTLPRAFQRPEFFLSPLAYACYRQDLYPVQWMMARAAVADAGGFPEAFDVMEDRAFLNRFLTRWRVAILDQPLAFHHRRVERHADSARSGLLNTLDNPSYDWRRFADMALPARPCGDAGALSADALRPMAVELLTELNNETSALWHKIDGEIADLRARLARPGRAPEHAPSPDARAVAYDLWAAMDGQQIAFPIAPAHPFAGRFSLSQGFAQDGRLLFLSAPEGRLELQLPETRDWAAVEVDLADLLQGGAGLRCHLHLWSCDGYLFETALSRLSEGVHKLEDAQVHSCPPGAGVHVARSFDAAQLDPRAEPKLSVILPRQARNFRFCCTGFVVERL